ncbi:MAG: Hpt domain-containing protein [Bacteroidetes bacterium]|nr:Hpt domain-containing protein [Bacteroidota bacterium]
MGTTATYTNLGYLRLMADGDEEMIQTMLAMLLEELPEEVGLIKSYWQAENWAELARVCHKMKSTLAFVGNGEMTAANQALEKVAKHKTDLHRSEGLVATLEGYLPHVVRELARTAENG